MYIFKIDPVGKPRMTHADKWLQRPPVMRYFAFKDTLNLKANQQKYTIANNIDLIFLIPMPESWTSEKKGKMLGVPHQSKPDTDNLLKAFCDALALDDSTIWNKHARKFWWHTGAIIVLNNSNDLDKFDPGKLGIS